MRLVDVGKRSGWDGMGTRRLMGFSKKEKMVMVREGNTEKWTGLILTFC